MVPNLLWADHGFDASILGAGMGALPLLITIAIPQSSLTLESLSRSFVSFDRPLLFYYTDRMDTGNSDYLHCPQ